MSPARCVQPEWLDALDPDDPRASRSRRDLQRVNRVMGNAAILARALRKARLPGPRLIVELGAGDGTLLLRVLQRRALRWQGGTIIFVDRQSLVSTDTRAAFHALGWEVTTVEADVPTWLQHDATGSIDLMLANLFLHHFHAPQLRALLASAAARTDLFVACEPRRSYGAVTGSYLLGAIGCNDVSRHDAVLSVRAGFADRELSELWPASSRHRLEEHAAGLFSHCFVAHRA